MIMKKFLALISAATIFCSATPFAVNAADDENNTPTKNWDYFVSLSDEEVEEEFEELFESGNISDMYWYREAIENYGSAAEFINVGYNYEKIQPWEGIIYNLPELKDVECSRFDEKDAEYYGFTTKYYNVCGDDGIITVEKVPFDAFGSHTSWVDDNGIEYFTNKNVTCSIMGGCFRFPSLTIDIYDAYNLLRLMLTFYNSPFGQEYGNGAIMSPCFPADGNSYLAGDINLDANVDISDLVAVTCYCIDSEANPICKAALEVADVYNTGDGVNSLDALTIQQYLVKMISEIRYAPETEYNC
jgi:hypothetical protein